ncbi:unnamed protein product [Prunus armeniaca]|uniref:Uncharacterized protein n=1 Tax=Prunus armeniaca TaxID=36596 RepID=A0A6J5WDU2_PRUAR|nr:unnamed protein product [Prunus armeniaca]
MAAEFLTFGAEGILTRAASLAEQELSLLWGFKGELMETALQATELVPCRGSKAGDGLWWWQVAGGEIPAEVAGGETPAEMAGGGIPMVVASGGGWQVAAVVVVG